MTPFTYERPRSLAAAVAALAAAPDAGLLGGGTCLLDLMKQGVERPQTIIDLNFAPDLQGVTRTPAGALRVGAATPLSHVARSAMVEAEWSLLHETIVDGLTPQLRNAASFAGNIMQRPRCIYFREADFPCNKKQPGSGCAAQAGVHYTHAIFGGSEASECIAVHPSDLCVTLTAFAATIEIAGIDGVTRRLSIDELHRLPGTDPTREVTLRPGEIITAVEVQPQERRGGAYVKGTEGFTLASCSALLDVSGGFVRDARVVLGGVAHKPWRSEVAERELIGHTPDAAAFGRAVDATIKLATTDFQTAFRLPLLRGVMMEAFDRAIRHKGRA